MNWLDEVNWDARGLVPVIVQAQNSGRLLTLAWMNRDALLATVREQRAVYWSRSRQRLWRKGEESGHVQKLIEIRLDCDADAILLVVDQVGGIACHTGRERCFYRKFDGERWETTDPILRDPAAIYDR